MNSFLLMASVAAMNVSLVGYQEFVIFLGLVCLTYNNLKWTLVGTFCSFS